MVKAAHSRAMDTPANRVSEPSGAPPVATPAAHSTPAATEQAAAAGCPQAR